MGELCLVPESFLCLVPEEFRDPGTDSDLESGGVGVERAKYGEGVRDVHARLNAPGATRCAVV